MTHKIWCGHVHLLIVVKVGRDQRIIYERIVMERVSTECLKNVCAYFNRYKSIKEKYKLTISSKDAAVLAICVD